MSHCMDGCAMGKDGEVTSVRMDKTLACALTACAHLLGKTQQDALNDAARAWLAAHAGDCLEGIAQYQTP